MFKYFQFNLKGISQFLLFLLPISLLTGPAIPDISITIIALLFLINSFWIKDFEWLKEKWILAGLCFWLSLVIISFFAINIKESLQNAFIFIRYIFFSIAVSYWLINEKKTLIIFLKILTLTLIFVIIDCIYQFVGYESLKGFGEDIFGFTSTHYGRLSGPFNDDIPGSHISRYLFFSIFLFVISKKTIYINNFTLLLFTSLSIFIIWLSGEAMALATTVMGILIYIFLINQKKFIIIIATFISIVLIFVIGQFHKMNYDYKIISSTPYHHGLIINKFGECEKYKNLSCSKLIKTNPKFYEVIKNFDKSVYYHIYKDALNMWKDNILTGVGLNNYENACIENEKYRSKKINYGSCSSHPHNIYIQFLSESGLIGFTLFIIFVFLILIKIIGQFSVNNKFSLIHFFIIFWPIMSTGSLLKNWYGIEVFLVIALLITLSNLNYLNSKFKFN